MVTAAAALDSGKYTPDSIVDGSSPQDDQRRAAARTSADENFGPITLTDALTNSVNTVFAQVGEKLGEQHAARLHGALRLQPGARRSTTRDEQMIAERRAATGGGLLTPTTAWTSGAWRSARSGHAGP